MLNFFLSLRPSQSLLKSACPRLFSRFNALRLWTYFRTGIYCLGIFALVQILNPHPAVASTVVNPGFTEYVTALQDRTPVSFDQSSILSQNEDKIINYGPLYQPQPRKDVTLSPGFHDRRRTLAVNLGIPRHPDLLHVVPQLGQYLLADGRVIVRTVADDPNTDLWITGDFNQWTYPEDRFKLQVDPDNPYVRYIILPPDPEGYHLQYYALVRGAGAGKFYLVTDPASNLVSSPVFYHRLIAGTPREKMQRPLGNGQIMPLSVFWFPPDEPRRGDLDPENLPVRTNIGETAYVALTTDLTTYVSHFICQNPQSSYYGSPGSAHVNETYLFVTECNVPQHIRNEGYSAVQFYPNVATETHADQRQPYENVPDWRYWYLVRQYMTAGQSDQGTPSEYRQMLRAFNQVGLSAVVDFVFAHNAQPYAGGRFYPEVLMGLSGQGFLSYRGTEWGTLRPKFDNPGFRLLIREALIKFFYEGYEGVRMDNVDGVSWEPGGESLVRDLAWDMMLRDPSFQAIGEMYSSFDDRVISPAYTLGYGKPGSGLAVGYTDDFNARLSKIARKNPDEYSLFQIAEYLRNPWRWLDVHGWRPDDINNIRDPDDIHGKYPVEGLSAGPEHSEGKIMTFTALKMGAGSYYIDAAQVFTLQGGNLATNGPVIWENLSNPGIARFHQAIVDFRSLIAHDPYHAWYNQHFHNEKWLDNVNKVITFEYWNPETDLRRHLVINMADRTHPIYEIEQVPLPQGTVLKVVYRSGLRRYLGSLPDSAIGEETTIAGVLNVNHKFAIPRGLHRYEVVVIDEVPAPAEAEVVD
jgi:hypothetical protein